MRLTPFVLTLILIAAAPVAAKPANPNLDFATGTRAGWEGDGFVMAPGSGSGPRLGFGVISADRDKPGRTAMIHRTISVPPTGGFLYCTAFASRAKGASSDANLDVVVLGPGKKVVPRWVRIPDGWKEAPRLLSRDKLRARQYMWNLDAYAGQTLRVAVVDEDSRPGCHVFCSGFRIYQGDPHQARDFAQYMLKLTEDHKLPPMARLESKHFSAITNAGDEFATMRLNNCELIYDLYYKHFRGRGFRVYEPSGKLMAAVFDSQDGFESYVAMRLPMGVTGLYHPKSNRLVVYDFGSNMAFKAEKEAATASVKRIASDLDRIRYVESVNRQAQEFRTGTNISTIMHEVAHQLSFNSGLLNRDGDVALWLCEGMACYCEATENGSWQGIGEANSERLRVLALAFAGKQKWIPLEELIISDAWLSNNNGAQALVGYSQSWALFKMLMEERPQQMKYYLELIYDRRTMGTRMADFTKAFGNDMARMDLRFEAYMREQLEAWRPKR